MMSLDGEHALDVVYKPLRKPPVKKLKEKVEDIQDKRLEKEKVQLKERRKRGKKKKIDFESMATWILNNKKFIADFKLAMAEVGVEDLESEEDKTDSEFEAMVAYMLNNKKFIAKFKLAMEVGVEDIESKNPNAVYKRKRYRYFSLNV